MTVWENRIKSCWWTCWTAFFAKSLFTPKPLKLFWSFGDAPRVRTTTIPRRMTASCRGLLPIAALLDNIRILHEKWVFCVKIQKISIHHKNTYTHPKKRTQGYFCGILIIAKKSANKRQGEKYYGKQRTQKAFGNRIVVAKALNQKCRTKRGKGTL